MRATCLTAAILGAALAGSAAAQMADTSEVRVTVSQIARLHAGLDGKIIDVTGALGTLIGDTLYFRSADGLLSDDLIEVQFDAGREARRLVEGCSITLFGNADPRCVFDVEAELDVIEPYNLPDGGRIRLIILDVN